VNRRTRAYVGLTGAALVFGVTFVVIKDAVTTLPPLAFVGWRFLLGAVALFLFARPGGLGIWRDGLLAGVLLYAGYAAQTAGLAATTASNSGLITDLYVVFTPLLAAAVMKRSPAPATIGGATLVVAVLGLGSSAVFEGFPIPPPFVVPALVATGVIVSAGAFPMQADAQSVIGPSRTAIVLSAEPLFAAVTAALVLGERLTARGWIGAAMIMVGVYVVLTFTPPELADLTAAEAVSEAH